MFIKRKRCLFLLPLLLLLLAACGSNGREKAADFSVVVATDLHYLAPELTDHGEYFRRVMDNGDGKVTEYCDEITDAFLSQVLEIRPQALILTGDLSFNGELQSHERLAEKLAVVEKEGVPVLVLPGNHDLYRSQAAAFLGDSYELVPSVTSEEFREIYAPFGFDEALSEDADSLSYVAALDDSTWILMLDANTLHDFCGMSEATLHWIDAQLDQAEAAGVKVLAACHQNLYQHSMFDLGYVLNKADALHELLKDHGVELLLSGHLHIQHWITREGVTEIATSSLTMGECQFGLLQSREGSLSYETRPVDMDSCAEKQGIRDEQLLRLHDYARETMAERTREQAKEHLGWLDLRPEDAEAMMEYAAALNLAYFGGDLTEISSLDPDGALQSQWENSGTLFGYYFTRIRNEIGKSYCHWESGQ